ncbi:MAG: chemotaxis protein CheC [Euryarchaeota archaeon]|nr:chemotaxis protein CheC [Euryarchaeota archaeon]
MSLELSELQRSALAEMGNIGAAHAATALSQMLKRRIDLRVPEVRLVSLDTLHTILEDPETPVAAILLRLFGSVTGRVVLMIPRDGAIRLARLLTETGGLHTDLSEMELSAVSEVGNILTGSYLGAASRFLNLTLIQSTPQTVVDMAGSVYQSLITDVALETDMALLIETDIREAHTDIRVHFILVPDHDVIPKFLDALGVGDL